MSNEVLQQKKILCSGIVTVDIVMRVGEIPFKAQKYRAESSTLAAGGCAYNAALAAAVLGGRASLAGFVGDDLFGNWVLSECERNGIETENLNCMEGVATPHSSVFVDKQGERMIMNYRENTSFQIEVGADSGFDVLLIDTRWPLMAEGYIGLAKERGVPIVADAEAPIEPARKILKNCTHIAFSMQGLADYAGSEDISYGLKKAREDFGAFVCVTNGADPVVSFDGKTLAEHPVEKVEAINTLGAGDVWHGAFALFLAEGFSEDKAIDKANQVAALMVSSGNGRPPTRQEIIRFYGE